VTILCYHTVDTGIPGPIAVAPAAFAEHCRRLGASRTLLDLTEAVGRLDASGRLPRGQAAVTFDDGFAGVYRHAFKELVSHRIPATVFLVAETLTPDGRVVDWVDPAPPAPMETLTLDQVLEMREAGVAFGSHSYAHHDLTALSEAECERDLRESRELLESLLGGRVPFLAYPKGRHDERVRRAAARAGYTHAFTLPDEPERVSAHSIPRVGVYPGNGNAALRVKLARWYLPVRKSRVFPALRRAVRGGRPARRPAV
jgi:peptidoglycan/xylan/chitin deacetylase (PgdA/CDA1 family)